MKYEVELRGLLAEEQYNGLIAKLKATSDSFESDDKITRFYEFPEGILKTVQELSKDTYKLSLKIGDEFAGNGLEEHDVYLENNEALQACEAVLQSLGYREKSLIKQDRMNFHYQGAWISLKYTPSWSYHFEIEKVVENQADIETAREKLLEVCAELGISPLSPEALEAFIRNLPK